MKMKISVIEYFVSHKEEQFFLNIYKCIYLFACGDTLKVKKFM